MSELRMYVEHLFEGRVLTNEMIELKEEIYGNLVARYEDYVAGGMDAAEALERTKASITSVDDVLAGEGPSGDDAAQTRVMAGGTSGAEAVDGAAATGAAASQQEGDVAATTAMPRAAGAPVPPDAAGAVSVAGTSEHARTRKRWPLVAGIAAAVVVAVIALVVLFNVVVEPATDYAEDVVEDVVDSATASGTGNGTQNGTDTGNGAQKGAGNGNGNGTGTGAGAGSQTTPQFTDPEDQREYEATTALITEVGDSPASLLQAYAGRANTAEVGDLAAELPLGASRHEAGLDTANAATAYIDYTDVSEDIDGDAIDRALVYNAAAIFSVYPDIATVRVSLQEVNDGPWDADTYAFDRTRVEQCFANASNNTIAQLNGSLVQSVDTWDQVRSCIMDRHEFAENVVDWSETN